MASRSLASGVVSPITVRISSRNILLCEALVRLLRNRTGFCVQGMHPGVGAGAQSDGTTPCDVLLVDSLNSIRASGESEPNPEGSPASHLLFFGMEEDPERFLEAICLGASGYLLNDASSEDIVQAIKMVARGEAVCPPKLCMFLFQRIFAASEGRLLVNEAQDARTHNLTMRQRQLMDLVSKGLSNKEIATRLNLSQCTVKNHIRRVMRNVDAESRHQAVDLMRASGVLPLA
jgi:DNA-binding NarL/FixJ family response regulator